MLAVSSSERRVAVREEVPAFALACSGGPEGSKRMIELGPEALG